ncbi:hypothetical protein GCM10012286_81800 [Streptomyces lasiicapitis]|uniref:Transposase n=1 Tax=Streptomyces lasiicapitis TaxID=1923961 RepID=A0ABQ2MVP2_9ACTN|nr:hypothetical protein GCM10012286_81800 [Streptomyces lasiicapitis]
MQLHHLTRRLDSARRGPRTAHAQSTRQAPTGSPRDQQDGSQGTPTARTGVRGHKKIALDPAESSAINDAPKWHRRGARWGGSRVVCSYMSDVTARLGDPAAVVLIVRCVLLTAA